ncbi:DNA methyltransferase [Treponema pedis]|uniref:DNA methyltransferase n=1 Tax=Treponema pedis TaxID=409322 RepID=UPI003D1C10DD
MVWKKGKNVPRYKKFLSETKDGFVPTTLWFRDEVGDNQEAKQEVKTIDEVSIFPTPKPERLIERIITLASNPNDLVLDSFLGSGTTAAVAHKMGRRWIGIEMGEHAYSHCKVRLDKVISGEDQGGISKAVNWQGGGGYTFYKLAPTLINIDSFGQPVINEAYSPDMLSAAVALHEGFIYKPDADLFWKQSVSSEKSFLFVTTRHITAAYLQSIQNTMQKGEYLTIACTSFDSAAAKEYPNITVKKIPQMLLEKCEFGKNGYNLNIINPPVYEEDEE